MATVEKSTNDEYTLQDLSVPEEQAEAKGGQVAGNYSTVSGRITGIAVDPSD